MAGNVKPKRAYDASRRATSRRAEVAAAMLDAGRQLFLEHGYRTRRSPWSPAAAGVSVQTVYKAFDNKPGLVKALVDVALVGDDEPVPMMEREFVQQNMAEPDPRKKLLRLRRPTRRDRAAGAADPARHPRRGRGRPRRAAEVWDGSRPNASRA